MMTGKKIILFGAGIVGRRALDYFGADKVFCFADNNKAGQMFLGKQVICFDDLLSIYDNYDILTSAGIETAKIIQDQCAAAGIPCMSSVDAISHEGYKSESEIQRFKNKYKNGRCFLVGNGPSLRASDLTKLREHSEISFGCNSIYKIFDQTPWRPDFHVAADAALMTLQAETFAAIDVPYKFYPKLSLIHSGDTTETEKIYSLGKGQIFYFNIISGDSVNGYPHFSPDPSKAVYNSATIMYIMIQLAVYMGFSRIYLVGVDGGSVMPTDINSYVTGNHHFYKEEKEFLKNYVSTMPSLYSPANSPIIINTAFCMAEEYTRAHGVQIFNATRGGTLETFERVNFETLFLL